MKRPVKFYLGKASPGVLVDTSRTGKARPWVSHKLNSVYLADSFRRLQDFTRASKIHECGTWLKFSQCPQGHLEGQQLLRASFCRQRLCPLCSWRRSLLVADQVLNIAHQLHQDTRCRFLFFTLTCRNVQADELSQTFTHLVKALSRFFASKPVKAVVLGSFRALEVTVSRAKGYHPHFHLLLSVPKTYFSKGYLTQEQLTELWRRALGVDYVPIVDVRAVKASGKGLAGAAAETAKYTLKASDYIDAEDWDYTDRNVSTLHLSLKGRRSYAFTGNMKETYRQLYGTADLEVASADLVAADLQRCECPVCQSDLAETVFRWNWKEQNYVS